MIGQLRVSWFVTLAVGVLGYVPSAVATEFSMASNTYGTSKETILQVTALGFRNANPAAGDGYVTGLTGTEIDGPFNLPSGALISGFTLYYYDDATNTTNAHVQAFLVETSGGNGVTPPTMMLWGPVASNSNGYNVVTLVLAPALTVNSGNQYYCRVFIPSGLFRVKSIGIHYRLQVSPAPATATFGDVPPSHPFFRVIEALGASGITTGCGGGNFCPDGIVTRAQMAKFLANALGLNFPE